MDFLQKICLEFRNAKSLMDENVIDKPVLPDVRSKVSQNESDRLKSFGSVSGFFVPNTAIV